MLEITQLRGAHFGPVDLTVAPGQCVAVQGASGSGKTLLLRAIADLDPNAGSVSWRGQERSRMSAPEWRCLVGLVPAESGWWGDQVGDHFLSGTDVTALLEAADLPADAVDWDVARLSTGEKHRLAIVRALALTPDVVLLDEPTAALDGEATARIEAMIRQQLEAGVAVVLVSHDPAQVARLATASYTMTNGRFVEAGQAET